MDCTIVLPSPGHANTFSTNTVPATIADNSSPPNVIVAVNAFGSPCRRYTSRAGNRFARAVRMKSACNTDNNSTRTIRASTAAGPNANATTGSTYDATPERPATGAHPRCTLNTYTRPTPIRNSGTADTTTLVDVKASSAGLRPPPPRPAVPPAPPAAPSRATGPRSPATQPTPTSSTSPTGQ